jgi:hypothetical protein
MYLCISHCISTNYKLINPVFEFCYNISLAQIIQKLIRASDEYYYNEGERDRERERGREGGREVRTYVRT